MTRYLVFDTSFTVKHLLPNPQQVRCMQLLNQWQQEGYAFCAPTLWVYEIVSSLNKLVHFQQIQVGEAEEAMRLAEAIDMELVSPQADLMNRAFTWTRQLNRAAAYDSFYLALAEVRQCELWTADSRLAHLVNEPWVKLVGA